ncbi:MAG: LamG-like jellyroll fold domain-containing protein [Bacteroidota bacterium]
MRTIRFFSIACCLLIAQNIYSQGKIYVNDNSLLGDVFTTAIGSDANTGSKSSPLASLPYALSLAQEKDTIMVDAGTYILPTDLDILKAVTILGSNYNLSPNSAADKKVINGLRNAESIITNATLIVGASNISLQGLTFDPGVPIAVYVWGGNLGNISLLRNRMRMTSSNAPLRMEGTGNVSTSKAGLVNTNFIVSDNRFENYTATSVPAINASLLKNLSITNNSFVSGADLRSFTVFTSGANGINDAVLFSGNYIENAVSVVTGNRIGNLQVTNNIINNSSFALLMTNLLTESSNIEFSYNMLTNTTGGAPFLLYNRNNGSVPGATNILKVENNTITGVALASVNGQQFSSMLFTVLNPVLNPTFIIKGNKITYNGDFTAVESQNIRPVTLRGKVENATLDNNEIVLNNTGTMLPMPAGFPLPANPAITIVTDNGSAVIPPNAVLYITNNKISGFKQSVAFYDGSSSGNPFTGYGNLPIGATVNINGNSFTGDSISINNGNVGQQVSATCNWFGKNDAFTVESKISSSVSFNPWLPMGIDISTNIGFQPVANSCPVQANELAGTALDFDGVDDYVQGVNSDFPQGNAARTIEAWIKPATTQDGTIISWGSATTTNGAAGLQYKGGKLHYTGLSNDLTGVISIAPNVWTHVAATFDGTNLKLYVNGEADATSAKIFATAGTTFRFGSNLSTVPADFFKGKIDEVRIWNKALSACEIRDNMKYELRGTETGLTGYYKFNQGIANSINAVVLVATAANGINKNGNLVNFALSGTSSNWVSLGGVKKDIYLRKAGLTIYLEKKDTTACIKTALKCFAIPNRKKGVKQYQWTLNGIDIDGATKPEFDASVLNNNDTLRCKLTEVTDCGTFHYTSNSETIKVNLPVYKFTGNGNWDNPDNWSNKVMPPVSLAPCSQIIISQALTDTCILNAFQFAQAGSKFTVLPGRQLKITQFLLLNDSALNEPIDTTNYPMGLELPDSNYISEENYFDDINILPEAPGLMQQNNVSQHSIGPVELKMPPAGNQRWGSCTGWAVGYGIMGYFYKILEDNKEFEPEDKMVSPTFIWNQLNINDRGVHDSTKGAEMEPALEIVKQQGVPKWVDMPGTENYYEDPKPEATRYAALHKNVKFNYDRLSWVSISLIKNYLDRGWPVLAGIKVHQGFQQQKFARYPGNKKVYMSRWGTFLGQHAMVLCGYDDELKSFKFMNSWGPGWGNNGFIWITYEVFKQIIVYQDYGLEYGMPFLYVVHTEKAAATVTTKIGCQLDAVSVKVTGTFESNGASVFERGFCYSTAINPTVGNKLEKFEGGYGNNVIFLDTITNLTVGVQYYVRSYLKTDAGILYGNEDSLKIADGNPYSIDVVSGNDQVQYSQRWLKQPLVVVVKDILGVPVKYAKVEWPKGFNSSTGTLKYEVTYTDEYGKAYNELKMGLGGNYGIYPRTFTRNCGEVSTYFTAKYVEGVTVAGVTVKGGSGVNDGSNNLSSPQAVYVDDETNMFISDYGNNRIQKWAPGSITGVTVAGKGSNPNGDVYQPWGLHITGANTAVYAQTYLNGDGDMIRSWFPGATKSDSVLGPTVSQGDWLYFIGGARGIFVDASGGLYIAEENAHRVTKWLPGAQSPIIVAGARLVPGSDKVTIAGSSAGALNRPFGVFVDGLGNVYVADAGNHRVQKWAPGATSGITVAGGNGAGSAENQLNFPCSVFVTSNGTIYVADRLNHRVQKWAPGAKTGETVAGVGFSSEAASRLNTPTSLFIKAGFIYITEGGNARVSRWPLD